MENLKNISLLIVDDSSDALDILSFTLKEYVKELHTACDGEEGLLVYKTNKIDIVLSDIQMPNMDGLAMSQKIRELSPQQTIIIMSAFDDKDYLFKAINLDINKYIMKPIIDMVSLLDTLETFASSIFMRQQFELQNFQLEQQKNIIDKYVLQTISDLDGNIVNVSQACSDLTGFTRDELISNNHCPFKIGNKKELLIKNLWETISNDEVWKGELKNIKKNGNYFWVKTVVSPLFDFSGKKVGYSSIKEDITDKKKFEELAITDSLTSLHNRRYFEFYMKQELKKASRRDETYALLVIDVDFFKNYNDLYGHQVGDEALIRLSSVIDSHISSKENDSFRIGGEEFAIVLINKKDEEIVEYITTLQNDLNKENIEHLASPINESLTISIGAINLNLKNHDVTTDELFTIADKNLYKAKQIGRNNYIFTNSIDESYKNIDKVSKLKNRTQLLEELSTLHHRSMLVIFQITQIKAIESLHGIEIVDKVLFEKTKELENLLVDNDVNLYKINLKEFAILVPDETLFNKYTSLIKSFLIDNLNHDDVNTENIVANFTAGASSGITNLLNNASQALQTAINKNIRFFMFDENKVNEDANLDEMKDLKVYRNALYNGNIIPYFQPIVDVHTEKVVKYEALARLMTEDGSIISPYYFLKAASDDKSFEFFTRQLMQKIFNIYSKNDIAISINLTYENITSLSMITYIKNRLEKYGGSKITFEILESEDIVDFDIVDNFIAMIKEYGCSVSIDDFGSGYSNFTNLIKLSPDYLKLDGSLIEKLLIDKSVQTMIKALVTFAKETNTQTIAEFVSSKELATAVKECGIDLSQGYYYGKPSEPKEYGLIE